MKKSFAILLVLLVIAGSYYLIFFKQAAAPEPELDEPYACTMDALICPDGSAVGRTGPKCEFAACPNVPVEDSGDVKVGETKNVNGLNITVNKIVSDSRCPADAVCIQAGNIVANVTLKSDTDQETLNLTDGDAPKAFDSFKVSLVSSAPFPLASQPVPHENYKVTFKVEKL
ncbi:MAG: hypothetical protein WCT29_03545 [Candidatus Paceibacterota bacterium]|jgi:hypothetical protein